MALCPLESEPGSQNVADPMDPDPKHCILRNKWKKIGQSHSVRLTMSYLEIMIAVKGWEIKFRRSPIRFLGVGLTEILRLRVLFGVNDKVVTVLQVLRKILHVPIVSLVLLVFWCSRLRRCQGVWGGCGVGRFC